MSGPRVLAAAGAGLLGLVGGAHGSASLPIRVDAGRMMMKAIPSLEGGHRAVYFQASTETRDYQGDRILAKALIGSIPYFLQHGRIDLDHASVLGEIRGQRVDPYAYEIGRPMDARPSADGLVMVKAEIFSSKTPGNRWCEAADLFWASLEATPPVLWYPSVQGVVTNEAGIVAPDGFPAQEVRGMLWQTVALSRTPVSRDVPNVTTVPLRVFAKAMGSSHAMGELMERLRSCSPVEVPAPSHELTDSNLLGVLESLADAPQGQPMAALLGEIEARGIPQDQALAVIFALLTSPQ